MNRIEGQHECKQCKHECKHQCNLREANETNMKSNPALMPSLNCAHGKEETRVFHIRSLTSASTLVEVSPRPHDAISKADHCVAEQHPELLVALPPLLGLEDPLKPAPPSFSPFCTSQVCSARCEALEHILAHLPAGPPSYLGCARGESHAHAELAPGPWISTWTWHKLLGCSCQSSCPGLAALQSSCLGLAAFQSSCPGLAANMIERLSAWVCPWQQLNNN